MPPEKSVSAYKDIFFECQKMTIVKIFVKTAKKAWIGIECAAPREREVQCPYKGKAFDNVSSQPLKSQFTSAGQERSHFLFIPFH